ncbi:MAG TPA: hypothetical protein VFF13_06150 [archaeon]|nr:hypothetical protein [archaeon]
MPHFDVFLFNKKGVKKNMVLELENGDGILESIKSAMIDNNVSEVKIEGAEGVCDEIFINYFERSQYKSSNLKNARVILASGNYKLSYGELYGTMKIVTGEKPPMQGTVVRGKAKDGFKITLSFVELVDMPAK